MSATPTVAEIVSLLEKPLRLEQRNGYANRSATNGIAAYTGEWARRGEHAGKTRETRECFAAIRTALARYDDADVRARRQMLGRALQALDRIRQLNGWPQARPDSPPAESPAPRPVGGARGAPTPGVAAQVRKWRELDAPYEHAGKGKRPGWLERLPKLGIRTKRDLLMHFPRDHVPYKAIADVADGERVCVRGTVVQRDVAAVRRTRHYLLRRYAIEIADDSGKAWVTSFVRSSGAKRLPQWNPLALPYEPGTQVLVEGTVKAWGATVEIQHLESSTHGWGDDLEPGRLVPVYPLTDGVYQSYLRRAIKGLLDQYAAGAPESLPAQLRREHRLCEMGEALLNLHWPRDPAALARARRRLAFEEFLVIQLALAQRKAERQAPGAGLRLPPRGDLVARVEAGLPFKLTAAQRRVIGEIVADMASDRPMNRLLQGDVGSGKTVVAVAALIAAVDNGCQGALMAPTEILAEQHYLVLSRYLERFDIGVDLLIGAVKKRDKERIYQRVRAGETPVVVGTHALIQEGVEFHRLGMVVIDEQHRFGVVQRATLRDKGLNPEVLVMTATPIPRTLALTVYGDLDVSALDEMPPGRRPVKTRWVAGRNQHEAYGFARDQVAQGRQAYIVCPLIEESEKLEAEAAVRLYDELRTSVFPDLRLGLLHGRLSTADKEAVMESFRRGDTDLLVSTTVIEVGVDVPNASVMVVLNAERFGLAQLHQLRGRVGRSSHQSYCLLVTDGRYNPQVHSAADDPFQEGRRRMRVMVEQNDGFVIAEEDLLMRGPGEFYGTRQHGLEDLRVARMGQDVALLEQARQAACSMVEKDPQLSAREHALLRMRAAEIRRRMEAVAP